MKKSMLILICVLLCMFAFTAGVSAESILPDVLPATDYPAGSVQLLSDDANNTITLIHPENNIKYAYLKSITLSGMNILSSTVKNSSDNTYTETVNITLSEKPAVMDISLTLFGRMVSMVTKNPVLIDGVEKGIATAIDGSNTDASLQTTLSVPMDVNKWSVNIVIQGAKTSNQKSYTLNFSVADSNNTAPEIKENVANSVSADVSRYDAFDIDLANIFTDDSTDSSALKYSVAIGEEDEIEIGQNYRYIPMEAEKHTLKFYATDSQNAKSEAYTVNLNVADYEAPAGALAIMDPKGDGLLRTLQVKVGDTVLTDVVYEKTVAENGDVSITVNLPEMEDSSATVTADFDLLQDGDGNPLLSENNNPTQQKQKNSYSVKLLEYVGSFTTHYYEKPSTNPTDNIYTTYNVNFRKNIENNQVPVFKENITSPAKLTASQYEEWSFDLGSVFKDPEGENMTYTVKLGSGKAVATDKVYKHTFDVVGIQTLTFQATDGHGGVSAEYVVELEVIYIPSLDISTGDKKYTTNPYEDYISTVTVTGLEVAAHQSITTEPGKVQIGVLFEECADDAVFDFDVPYEKSHFGNSLNGCETTQKISLVNGRAELSFYVASPYNHFYDVTFKNSNLKPVVASDAVTEKDIYVQEVFEAQLHRVFSDADGDDLIYYVSVNDGEQQLIDAKWTYIPGKTGEHKLEFVATDGFENSDPYVVKLNAVNSETTYPVVVNVPSGITPAFYITDSFDGVNGDVLSHALQATAGEAGENGFTSYTVAVPENINTISYRGAAGETSWGGMTLAVEKDMAAVTLCQVKGVVKTASSVTEVPTGNDVDYRVIDANGNYAVSGGAEVEYDSDSNPEILTYRFLLHAAGDDISYIYRTVPLGTWADTYGTNQSTSNKVTADSADVLRAPLDLALLENFTITAPADATVQLFDQLRFYEVVEIDPHEVTSSVDGATKTYEYNVHLDRGVTYRASKAGEITKAGYANAASVKDKKMTITWDNDDRGPKYSEPYDTSGGYGRRGDDTVYLNINRQNHLILEKGETFRLKAYRIWQIINSDTENQMIEPDFTYDDLSDNGVVTIDPVEKNTGNAKNNWLDLEAKSEGVAFVEVGFDAIDILTGNSSSWGGSEALDGFTFNAVDPARTGLFVVQTDGKAATDVDFGIVGSEGADSGWYTDHDTIYFLDDYAELTFKPTVKEGSVSNAELSTDKGKTWTELTCESGFYTANLVSGNNILKVTKADGTTAYQVVRADKIHISVEQVEGNDNDVVEAGETFRLRLNGVHNTIGKMSTIYNPGYDYGMWTSYKMEGDNIEEQRVRYRGGQYSYVSQAYVDVQIPENAVEGDLIRFTEGFVDFNVLGGGPGSHYDVADTGTSENNNATSSIYKRSIYPDFTLTVGSDVVDSVVSGELEKEESGSTEIPEGAVNAGTVPDEIDFTKSELYPINENKIAGYVTISFEDNGIRRDDELAEMNSLYKSPLGTLIPAVNVPFEKDDTIAVVTLRLLDSLGYKYANSGSGYSGFYLSAIGNFVKNDEYYRSFGEFSAGVGSGWMITRNDEFINRGASAFTVKDGDVIKWQYTCQLGMDIGDTYSMQLVNNVISLIDAIGTVTKDSGEAIEKARDAYENLELVQQNFVTNYDKLVAAEKAFAELNKPGDTDKPVDSDPKDEVVVVDPSELPFTDSGDWYDEAVAYVYSYGLMNGTSDTTFAPDVNLNRAMMATILYRIEGTPKVTSANPFTDVPAGEWYTDAIIWAAENGIVTGYGDGIFKPTTNITREQMACMMYRYAKFKGADISASNNLAAFTDAGKVSSWADKEMKWAVEEGLINGMTKTTLVPQGTATRAQAATVLMRFNENILK